MNFGGIIALANKEIHITSTIEAFHKHVATADSVTELQPPSWNPTAWLSPSVCSTIYVSMFFFQRQTLIHGTTTATYFATIHLEATKELCRIIGWLRMLVYCVCVVLCDYNPACCNLQLIWGSGRWWERTAWIKSPQIIMWRAQKHHCKTRAGTMKHVYCGVSGWLKMFSLCYNEAF